MPANPTERLYIFDGTSAWRTTQKDLDRLVLDREGEISLPFNLKVLPRYARKLSRRPGGTHLDSREGLVGDWLGNIEVQVLRPDRWSGSEWHKRLREAKKRAARAQDEKPAEDLTSKDRSARYATQRKSEGLTQVRVWAPKPCAEQVREFARRLREAHGPGTD